MMTKNKEVKKKNEEAAARAQSLQRVQKIKIENETAFLTSKLQRENVAKSDAIHHTVPKRLRPLSATSHIRPKTSVTSRTVPSPNICTNMYSCTCHRCGSLLHTHVNETMSSLLKKVVKKLKCVKLCPMMQTCVHCNSCKVHCGCNAQRDVESAQRAQEEMFRAARARYVKRNNQASDGSGDTASSTPLSQMNAASTVLQWERKAGPYTILGIPTSSTEETIKIRYRRLVLLWHPDKQHERREDRCKTVAFMAITAAYKQLKASSL